MFNFSDEDICVLKGQFVLVGYKDKEYPGDEDYCNIVATFDTEKMAKNYLKKSKLRNSSVRKFRAKSLLCMYDDASIEKIGDPPPHNPEI